MKLCSSLRATALSALAVLSFSGVCAAQTIVGVGYQEKYQGFVSTGIDQLGLFGQAGTNLTSDPFTAIFFVDPTKGASDPNSVGTANVYGGSAYGLSDPVTAEISINGSPFFVVGSTGYSGEAHLYSVPGASAVAFDETSQYTTNLQMSLFGTAPGQSGPTSFGQSGSFNGFGSGQLNIQSVGGVTAEYLNLTPTVFSAPEPSTWALMLGGVGLIGSALRHRRRGSLVTA